MKIKLMGLVVALLVGAPVTQAAAPKSLVGTWKISSGMVNGKIGPAFGPWAIGAVWKINKDGTAKLGSSDNWKWTYDDADGQFMFKRPGLFGWREERLAFSATSQGNDIKFKSQFFLVAWVMVLTPN